MYELRFISTHLISQEMSLLPDLTWSERSRLALINYINIINYFQKENYVDDFNKCISDLYKMGSYDAALYETGILRKYMNYFKCL